MTFVKGQSGNPTGRPKQDPEIRDLARAKTPQAFKVIIDLLASDDEAIRLSAAKDIIDRAYGKAAQALDISGSIQSISVTVTEKKK